MSRAVCDGCGMLSVCKLGVCAMCRLDGVEQRETAHEERERVTKDRAIGGPPDNAGTTARARARALAIRAEDPEGWADVMGPRQPWEAP